MHLPLAPVMLALPLLSLPALAYEDGITGRSELGCGTCHGATAASTTSAVLLGPTTAVAPGTRVNLSLRVRSSSSTHTHAGLNASASGGMLQAGLNTVLSDGEITHAEPQALASGAINFRFGWRAPRWPGTYTIYAAGNAVNRNGAPSGDGWQIATPIEITVARGAMMPGESAAEAIADEEPVGEELTTAEFFTLWEAASLEAVDSGIEASLDGEAQDGAEAGAAGCSAAGATSGLVAALALLPALVRRRRG